VALAAVKRPPACAPFCDGVIQFSGAFSRALFKDSEALRYPELQALAFWMRKGEVARLRDEFMPATAPDTIRAPRGLVFHVPPVNVDTMFIYSWLMSALAGNRNIVRLSTRSTPQTDVLCRVFNATLDTAAGGGLRENTVMLRYGHEREITEAISAAADVRILWGGDSTINSLRSYPLPPHATELTFPDRYSFAVLHSSRYLEAPPERREKLAGEFFNDTFWFDQMACSSPRLLVWLGEPREVEIAGGDFIARLQAQIERRRYQPQPQTRLNRFAFACRAILDDRASHYQDSPQVTILRADEFRELPREHCGGGLLFQYRISALDELIPFVERRDQTMTYFGFEPVELRAFATRLNGRGVDRIVPTGQALTFNRFWDGYDLLQELTRCIHIRP
jgi:hypothetical protein